MTRLLPIPNLLHRAVGAQAAYLGGCCAGRLEPRSAVQRPMPLGAAEQFVIRRNGETGTYSPAVATVVLPASARWVFEAGPSLLRISLHCPPTATGSTGFVGLLHETGNLFVDRLRTRPWVPETAGVRRQPFRAVRPDELVTTSALAGELFPEPRELVWLRAADVLARAACSTDELSGANFAIDWPEADLEDAVRDLQARVQTNGTLLTDRLAESISSELLTCDAPGQFTIPRASDMPAEQGVKVLAVVRHGRRLRDAIELGDWNAAVFRVEPLAHRPGLLARLHCPGFVTNALVELVRYPTVRPSAGDEAWRTADAIRDDGLVAAAECCGPLRDLSPPRHALPRHEALRAVLGEYPRFDLQRLLQGPPECGEAVLWPSAPGLQAALPVMLRVRQDPRLSPRDLADLAADLDAHLAHHLTGPFHYRCRIEEVHYAS